MCLLNLLICIYGIFVVIPLPTTYTHLYVYLWWTQAKLYPSQYTLSVLHMLSGVTGNTDYKQHVKLQLIKC